MFLKYVFTFVQEEAVRVTGEMQKLAMEQVRKEHEEGEKRLEKAVAQTEKHCYDEKVAAVKIAREEEIEIAAVKAAEVAE